MSIEHPLDRDPPMGYTASNAMRGGIAPYNASSAMGATDAASAFGYGARPRSMRDMRGMLGDTAAGFPYSQYPGNYADPRGMANTAAGLVPRGYTPGAGRGMSQRALSATAGDFAGSRYGSAREGLPSTASEYAYAPLSATGADMYPRRSGTRYVGPVGYGGMEPLARSAAAYPHMDDFTDSFARLGHMDEQFEDGTETCACCGEQFVPWGDDE